jgi:hypothetical protein
MNEPVFEVTQEADGGFIDKAWREHRHGRE